MGKDRITDLKFLYAYSAGGTMTGAAEKRMIWSIARVARTYDFEFTAPEAGALRFDITANNGPLLFSMPTKVR